MSIPQFHSKQKEHRESITIVIDGKECRGNKGDSILSIARNNGINIPTLCDLKKLSPTGACRMCVVEEENGNVIASCKSYVTKPIRVKTNTEKLQKYRNQIMSFLCINHPLECGVCDKSGECELQDKVLESKVDIQPFFAVQKKNDFVHFHNKIYDESLCIVCERCARTCNEFVGNNVLSVLAGGFSSKIGVNFNAYCEDCDECVSVCPTGAMISQRFIYTTNAWELEKNRSHCLHCSMRCELDYEIKFNIDSKKEVYRIKNEAHINQLCHAGRHNFLRKLHNLQESKYSSVSRKQDKFQDSKNLIEPTLTNELITVNNKSIEKIDSFTSKVNAIRLGINASNEECYLAQKLADKLNLKLYCDEAYRYSEFGNIVKSISKKDFININESLSDASVCVLLGCYIYDEMPVLRSNLSKLSIKKGMQNIWINAISESRFKSDLELKYEIYNELSVCAILLNIFMDSIINAENNDFTKSLKTWLDNLDIGNLIAESNISDVELERLKNILLSEKPAVTPNHKEFTHRNKIVFLVGQDFYLTEYGKFIAKILGAIDLLSFITVLPISYGNANGIKEICSLSLDSGEFNNVLGIRAGGEFEISPMPIYKNMDKFISILPMQFIEGTVIDMNYNLVKLSPSFVEIIPQASDLPDLLDICRDFLGLDSEYIVEITQMLPFNSKTYDNLPLKSPLLLPFKNITIDNDMPDIDITCEGGIFVYKAALSGNFSFYKRENIESEYTQSNNRLSKLFVSKQFCIATKLKDGDGINLQIGKDIVSVLVEEKDYLRGMISILLSDEILDTKRFFDYKVV